MSWQEVRRQKQKKEPSAKPELRQLAAELRAALLAPRRRPPPGRGATKADATPPRKPEWTCDGCGTTNFLDRQCCRRCAAVASSPPARGQDPGVAQQVPPSQRGVAADPARHLPRPAAPPRALPGSAWASPAFLPGDTDMGEDGQPSLAEQLTTARLVVSALRGRPGCAARQATAQADVVELEAALQRQQQQQRTPANRLRSALDRADAMRRKLVDTTAAATAARASLAAAEASQAAAEVAHAAAEAEATAMQAEMVGPAAQAVNQPPANQDGLAAAVASVMAAAGPDVSADLRASLDALRELTRSTAPVDPLPLDAFAVAVPSPRRDALFAAAAAEPAMHASALSWGGQAGGGGQLLASVAALADAPPQPEAADGSFAVAARSSRPVRSEIEASAASANLGGCERSAPY